MSALFYFSFINDEYLIIYLANIIHLELTILIIRVLLQLIHAKEIGMYFHPTPV